MTLPTTCQSLLILLLSSAVFSQVIKAGGPNVRTFWIYPNATNSVLNNSAKNHLTSSITSVMISVILCIVLIIGLPANGLALLVLVTKVQRMPSTIFLTNLATADLLLILVLPFKIHYYFQGTNWVFGEALCRMTTAFFYGNMYCSILLLTFISIDRYLALVHPFLAKGFRDNKFAVGACLTIWVLVGLAMIPLLLQKQAYSFQDLNITTCHDAQPEKVDSGYFLFYFTCLTVIGFLIPCLVTIFCYVFIIRALVISDEPFGQAVRNMVLVLIVYVVCFSPSNIILLIHYFGFHNTDRDHLYLYYIICQMLSTFNNCIDPFIYYYVSNEFRNKVRSTIFFMKTKDKYSLKSAQPQGQTSSSSGPGTKMSNI
ncbi:proteinase-activated receptor 3-like [Narcine bancroftii]|uniref:proteinase-activated receptor 3-like n=1 Tax=Narcine bancroftii TaxID=1343680 RepID=UPI0038320EAA